MAASGFTFEDKYYGPALDWLRENGLLEIKDGFCYCTQKAIEEVTIKKL